MTEALRAPMPYFGGKSVVADEVWSRLGRPKQYIEPFCGSAAVLLAAPQVASLEVVNDANGFIANFWRCVKHQPGAVAEWADYPVSHVDLGARHGWLMRQRAALSAGLADPDWPGDAKVAGWWLWGCCAWIGSGWCDWFRAEPRAVEDCGQVPQLTSAGQGVQAAGQIPLTGNAGRGVQAVGQIPQIIDAGRGSLLTTGGRAAWGWMHRLADRLERVRVLHGSWDRCLNRSYGGDDGTAYFLDPPYKGYDAPYGCAPVAADVESWARENGHVRVALCGHDGDYDLPGWEVVRWKRPRLTYGGAETTDREAIWFSPACEKVKPRQGSLF